MEEALLAQALLNSPGGHTYVERRRGTWMRVLLIFAALFALNVSSAIAQVTRVEQNDPSITYSGNWYTNSSSAHSGGLAALTNARGARATITFTGTGITWLGVMDGWAGLANVYLDGRMTVVDTFGSGGYQQPLYIARGLTSGTHTLSIEVTHERDANTQGSWVWIDAFNIENGSTVPGGVRAGTGRVEENHPALVFAGRWFSSDSAAHSGGRAALAMDAGSRVSISFEGTGISWVGYRDEWSGIGRVFVDGEIKTTIDAYLAPARPRTVLYTIGALPPGTHTLTIEATGTRNESSKGSWIWLDAFDVAQ
jgi:hypothetical protein